MSMYRGGGNGEAGWMVAAQGNRLAFVQKVYALFLAGVLVSVCAAGFLWTGPSRVETLGNGQQVVVPLWVMGVLRHYGLVVIAFFVTFFIASATRRKPGLNLLMLFLFTAVTGWMIAPQLFAYSIFSPGAVPLAGALTAAVFLGLTVFAFVSKRDFNFLGAGLFVALWGLIIAGLLNAFIFHSAWAWMFRAWVGVVIFSLFVIYDTSRLLRRLPESEYVIGALELYLDFINLFLLILRLLGGRK
ncbi:MAG: Bax inhibitor-1 family protein [Armatimonadetes bacterium]|nr:Bax inhibitor-1 family protein [Armatimonadota bacterium]